MGPHPGNECVEVALDQCQIEDAEPYHKEEGGHAEGLGKTLAAAAFLGLLTARSSRSGGRSRLALLFD